MTANAKRVLDIINASTAHPTAEDIYRGLISRGEKMSLATVYNSLGKLYEEGQVRKIPMEGAPDRYDKTRRHDHLVCERCGAISDAMLDDFCDVFAKSLGVAVDSYDLKLFWLCDKCKAAGAENNEEKARGTAAQVK